MGYSLFVSLLTLSLSREMEILHHQCRPGDNNAGIYNHLYGKALGRIIMQNESLASHQQWQLIPPPPFASRMFDLSLML